MCVDLRQNGETGQRAFPAGDVERRVPVLIDQSRVAAGLQEHFDDVRLLCDNGQVERRLKKTHQPGKLLTYSTNG